MISDVCQTLLSLSISGSIIALFLFSLKPLIHNRLNKTWQFYIWLVVVARLLIPYVPPINIVEEVSKFIEQNKSAVEIPIATEIPTNIEYNSELQKDADMKSVTQNESSKDINKEIVRQQVSTEPPVLTFRGKPYSFSQQFLPYIGLVWLIICLVLFVRKVTSYYSFIRFVKKDSKYITENTVLEQYKNACQVIGIKKMIPLYSNNIVVSPMCIGFFRPFIVLPDKHLDNLSHLHYIFRHELTHYRRLDIYYKWLVQIVLCIHWFNPIAYFVSKEVNKYCELSCDETVIKKLNTAEQKAYGDTLLHSLELCGHYSNTVVSLTLAQNTKLMKERLGAIMKFKHKSKISVFLSALLAVVLSTGAMFTGVYAESEPNEIQAVKNAVSSAMINENETIRSAVDSAVANETDEISNAVKAIKSEMTDEILNSMPPILNNFLYATGYSSNWAAATSIEGNTYKEQLNEKINWIENIYNDKKEKFAIVETVSSENELTNLIGAQYMIENSPIYNNIISNNDSFSLTPYSGNWFSKTSKQQTEYERSIFSIDKESTLSLKAKFELSQGKMAIMIVSPDFKTVYRSEQSKKFDDTIIISLSEGLWSIVSILEYEKGSIIGSKNIEGNITYTKDSKESVSRSDSLIQNFEKYKPFGVTYNAAQDTVYYNGEKVKLFVDFKSYKEENMTYSFDFCYQGSNVNSTIYLEAVKNDRDTVIGVRPLKKEIAQDLLRDMVVSANDTESLKGKDNINNDYIPFVIMDATHKIDSANIVATDKISKKDVPANVRDWISECDKNKGAYTLTTKTENGYNTYIYYNGGGRYPWTMSASESKITVNLYRNLSLATNDGYYLMYFTTLKDYKSIKLYLDDQELNVTGSKNNSTQINTQNDKLIEKEYTKADLKAMNVSGIILDVLSENISVTRGGETLKLKFYQSSDNDYVLDTQPDMGGKIEELSLRRTSTIASDEVNRIIFVTIPNEINFEIINIQTESGNITVDKCRSNILKVETQSGQVMLDGGSVNKMLLAKSFSGNINITGAVIPQSNYLESDTGAITLQLLDFANNYKFHIDTNNDAKIIVNDRTYTGGDFTINDNASSNIYFDSKNGSLIVNDIVK